MKFYVDAARRRYQVQGQPNLFRCPINHIYKVSKNNYLIQTNSE